MARMHPQTLRKYERYGFVSPNRTSGSQRLYSDIDVNRLLVAKRLIDEFGLNLNGVRLILEILDVINAWKNILKRDPQISKFQDVREIVDGIDTLINQIYNRKTK
ncbi:MAG: MerR family transcriptional regulator [SAR202 cluster bacterium]|nr:MerR family transcriptional regulator [SAR202 cluster bacterium]